MFSGLIEEVGEVLRMQALGDGFEFAISAHTILDDCSIDDSIAVQGVCLTVIAHDAKTFRVQAVEQTLKKTSLGTLKQGSRVNLERALLPTTRLGGHFVQGHVDCVGTLASIRELSTSHELLFHFDPQFQELVVSTGSICVNGISLTLAEVHEGSFLVAIIPHTWSHTTISDLRIGDHVNLEFDILGKYVAAALKRQKS